MYARHGAGVGEERGLLDRMDIISGTLGKVFGLVGGYIVNSTKLVDTIRSYGSGFIFTTSLPPMIVKGAVKSIDILASEEGVNLRERHQRNAKLLRNKIIQSGIPAINAPSHIIPVHVSECLYGIKVIKTGKKGEGSQERKKEKKRERMIEEKRRKEWKRNSDKDRKKKEKKEGIKERQKERKKERRKERRKERQKERKKERRKERQKERKKEGKKDRKKGRKKEGKKERQNEGKKEGKKERIWRILKVLKNFAK